jgi:hypothetical protein
VHSALAEEQPISTDKFQAVPTRTTRSTNKKIPAETAPAPTTATTNMAQDKNDSEDEQASQPPSPEKTPDDDAEITSELPERRARVTFNTMLAQIVEQPEIEETDRSIGNYEFQDGEWDLWKAGLDEHEDGSEIGYDSDGGQSFTTATTKRPLGRHASVDKTSESGLQTNKTKAKRVPKRKHLYQDFDSDNELESEVEGKRAMISLDALCTDFAADGQILRTVSTSRASQKISARYSRNRAQLSGPILNRQLPRF